MADGNHSPSKSVESSSVNSNRDFKKLEKSGSGDSPSQSSLSSKSESASSTAVNSPAKKNPTSGGNKDRRGGSSGYQKRSGASGGKDKKNNSQSVSSTTTPEESGGNVGGSAKTEQATTGSSKRSGNNNKNKYTVKKRAPPREDFEVKPNDVFVNEKSHFVAQLAKCKKLFAKGHREVHLHGLGKAIPRAVNIAFELKNFYRNTVDYTVNTSTLQVVDDLVDIENPEQPSTPRARNVSSVDIKVYRSINIP